MLEADRSVGTGDQFCDRVAQIVSDCIERCPPDARQRAIEIGCGSGWLCELLAKSFVEVYGTDLSRAAIEVARRKVPNGRFVSGDFLQVPLPEPADLVVSCEVVAHVRDQRAFLERCREVTRTGGRFLLLSQNPIVWRRTIYLEQHENRLRHWPTLGEFRRHFAAVGFELVSFDTFLPMGEKGLLRPRPYAQGLLRRIVGRPRAVRLFERIRLGRTMVLETIAV